MARDLKIYRCSVCGNIVSVLHVGGGELTCCGQAMKRLTPGENDTAAKEKHIPVVEVNGDRVSVTVGSVLHPMTLEHLIQWIAVVTDKEVYTKFLTADDTPTASFIVPEGTSFDTYEYCNLHGLWKV
mgnify:CR=1 FL=1